MSARICNREGCAREVFARAKCFSHYNSMIKSLRRQGSTLFAKVDTWTEIQKYMPGTLVQLAERSEIGYNAVRETINKRHAAGECHVAEQLPPAASDGGGRWVNVYALGPGEDHVVSDRRKKAFALRGRRKSHAALVARKKQQPQFVTIWNLAFFNPAEMRP
jgi:hypothetical protein